MCIYWDRLLNVHLHMCHLPLMQAIWSGHRLLLMGSGLNLLGYIFWLMWPDNLKPYKALQHYWCLWQRWKSAGVVLFSCSPFCRHHSFHVTPHMVIWWAHIRWPWWPILCTASTNPSVWDIKIQILYEMKERSVMLVAHLKSCLNRNIL